MSTSQLTIATTHPDGPVAQRLRAQGLTILPLEEEDAPIERYVISPRVAVTRRTGSSFLAGIQDKSLFTEALYLQENFALPILIMEGGVDYTYSAFNPQAVRGALTALLLQYGVSVLVTPDGEETAALLAMLARQEQVGIPEISLIPKRAAATEADLQRRVVEMLPGCGRVLARELLHAFGSLEAITAATERELRSVRGIGPRKAEAIWRTLHREYDGVDTERHLEEAIEADPTLLFPQPVELVGRQVVVIPEGNARDVIDMVFVDAAAGELLLVELKRGALAAEHEAQLRRYLLHAPQAPALRAYLERGLRLRGVLATYTACTYEPVDEDVTICIVEEARVAQVLQTLRHRQLEA